MAPTEKVAARPIERPALQPPSTRKEVNPTVPPPEYFLLTHDTNENSKSIYDRLRQDFKFKECQKFLGIFSCEGSYVFEPKEELTCDKVIQNYGLDRNDVKKLGLLQNLCDGSDKKTNAPVELPEGYFNQLIAKYQK